MTKAKTMPSTITCERGQVVVVHVVFSDGSGSKPRPVLVVSTELFHESLPDVLVCPISSQPRFYQHPGQGDYPLRQWEKAGLRHPSTVRISKLLAIDKRVIKRTLSEIDREDLAAIDRSLLHALGLNR